MKKKSWLRRLAGKFRMKKKSTFFTKDALAGRGYKIGDFSYGAPTVFHWGEPVQLEIGRFCSIAQEVNIFLGGNHRIDWVTTYPFSAINYTFPDWKHLQGHPVSKGDIIIGNDVWIGYGASIMSGVKIGDGAVIGAKAVVSRDVKPYEIVAGNPAVAIKKRFSDDIIEKLLELQWWNLSQEEINEIVPVLMSDPVSFFKNYKGTTK
jgi:acetyltransferase-like isoleucine patch superfamily enzyme